MSENEIRLQLIQNIGGDNYYFHPLFKGLKYTEGVRETYLLCNAQWLLIDVLATCSILKAANPFIVVNLFKNKTEATCYVLYEDGNNNCIKRTDYTFTDFPLSNVIEKQKILPAVSFFFSESVLYLPSEH
tara:strand:+ start:40 stop:429 length:390 start_codon:yes stop_codon:yes gene_type:complete